VKQSARYVLLAVTAVALIAAAVWQMRSSTDDPESVVRGELGPTPGPNSAGHVTAKRAYLDGLAKTDADAEAAALVSLSKYITSPAAQKLSVGTRPSAVFVRFPSSEGEVLLVSTTISGAVADRAAQLREEIQAEIESISTRAADAKGAEKTELSKLVAERKSALTKVSSDCACVYAFAVHDASISELKAMQSKSEVRLVDVPDPISNDLRGWELTPIVPKA
jgi:hypothetical protein